ncbi:MULTISPECIES: OadG family transporter subunit [Ruminococcus]|jgi:Na+-transporting methylmalonyl-CoA/oxaloacetate decarboxylase gamma subunit|uniref:Sodium pump decarboxylase, gamma subunit n=1 Tax=Ruminococcus albus 8 TaxID=246199 RepID=E9SH33_RUMAL|nr:MULTISPECIES: OadG family transporter subunit [Ruminococcus]EGC01361.1 sodium pump decarboxylase, gamma subunit [Ruminococcus albus 8]MBQ9543214.1 OadG family protein [Ruminococcus sp.]MCC3351023.1 OadG family protein [Ruminococcus albus 8]
MSGLQFTLAQLLSSNIPPDQTDLGGETIASVVITGISVVFIGLIILILLVTLYGKIFEGINKSAEAKAKAKAEAEAKAKAAEAKAEVKAAPAAPAPAPVVEDGVGEEVVAAIMGALSAMYAGSGKKPVLKGVKAVKPRRSAWSAAGVMENTRPF